MKRSIAVPPWERPNYMVSKPVQATGEELGDRDDVFEAEEEDAWWYYLVAPKGVPYKKEQTYSEFWSYGQDPGRPLSRAPKEKPKEQPADDDVQAFPQQTLVQWADFVDIDTVPIWVEGEGEKMQHLDYDEDRYDQDEPYRRYIDRLLYEQELAARRIQRHFRGNP